MTLLLRLSNTQEPIPFELLAREFTAYQYDEAFPGAGRDFESAKRTFERDKKELVDMGVPLQMVKKTEENDLEQDGYLINRARYLLPEIDLDQDEIAALAVTAAVARQQAGLSHASHLDDAWRKLSFGGEPQAEPQPVVIHMPQHAEDEKALGALEDAIRNRKRVTLDYVGAARKETTSRKIDPYGLVYRRRTWLVVAYCHLRAEVRTFRVDRITKLKVAPKPEHPDFEVPEKFDLEEYRRLSPWVFRLEASQNVTLEIDGAIAAVADEDFGPSAGRTDGPGGTLRVTFPCGNLPYLITRVLAAAGRMRVLEPEPVRQRIREQAVAIAAAYGGA
jgi:proteasome accessory factor B